MRRFAAPVFACGTVCCGLAGLLGAAVDVLLQIAPFGLGASFGRVPPFFTLFGVTVPLNMGLLPFTWAAFRRSPRRGLAMAGFGLLGGALTGLLLAGLGRDDPGPTGLLTVLIMAAVGLACGWAFPVILARL